MNIRVSATRMELLKLKRRFTLAVRGHRLLKDKQDELVRQFFLRQEEYRSHLSQVWNAIATARRAYELLQGTTSRPAIHLACQSAAPAPSLRMEEGRVLNLTVPLYRLPEMRIRPLYGLLEGAGQMENVLEDFMALVPVIVRKAELEKAMLAILREIEVTKRRVNALEYTLLPTLRESIRSIASKLSELELSTLTRLMRVKELIEQTQPVIGSGDEGQGHTAAPA